MKVNDIKTFDIILDNLFVTTDELNKRMYQIGLESNELISKEMIYDLKEYLIESFNGLEPIMEINQRDYIYENTMSILNTFSNIKKSENDVDVVIEELSKLSQSLIYNSKKVYIENSKSDYLDIINNVYLYEANKIIDFNNDLYSKEIMCLNELLTIDSNELFNNSVTGLMEGLVGKISETLTKIKAGFGNKHDKIVERDKKWLASNKKNILSKNYDEIQLEVLSDNKVTFENLLNRHNMFDKIFVNSSNQEDISSKLTRFEDKNGNLKNGLDNYFRTGTSRREIGLRKVEGQEAKTAVENMIAYCESFLAGKKFLEEKVNNILSDLDKVEVQESTGYSHIFRGTFNPYKITSLLEVTKEDEMDNLDLEEDDIDEESKDNKQDEKNKVEEVKDNNRGMKDRQTGIAVLLTVAEERYFDYIQILKGLLE